MKRTFILLFFIIPFYSSAQKDEQGKVTFSGYIETYYSYDFNQPENNQRPDFLYNYARHNEFNINLALLKANYESEKIRANLALMGGNYAQYNLANEPAWGQVINEASVGIKLHKKIWFDMGIMPSHIGFESWYGMDCWHLSRSILADNSPYFLTGARITYEFKPKLDIVFWATNGWQNVQRQDKKKGIGLGLGIDHRPFEGMVIHYANYFGNEGADLNRILRFYNNFYTQYEKNNWGLTLGVDYGIQEAEFVDFNEWYGITASVKRSIGEKFVLAGRYEYYSDPNAVIVNEGMRVTGFSANLDYQLAKNSLFRIEIRQFASPEAIFPLPAAKFSKGNTAITGAFAVRF
ncbi:porin [Shivajiella indica]|uniref:Porin n=1 Tax=Shivajiella indica TaxID=872115 RepID=A0ABW5BEK3_9BACT